MIDLASATVDVRQQTCHPSLFRRRIAKIDHDGKSIPCRVHAWLP